MTPGGDGSAQGPGGERTWLRTPHKIYDRVLLIVLVALREDGVCLGPKQAWPARRLERRDPRGPWWSLFPALAAQGCLSPATVRMPCGTSPSPLGSSRRKTEARWAAGFENPHFAHFLPLLPSFPLSLTLFFPFRPSLHPLSAFSPVCEAQICLILRIYIPQAARPMPQGHGPLTSLWGAPFPGRPCP